MHKKIKEFCDDISHNYNLIDENRKLQLQKIAHYIQQKKDNKLEINLVYICTHNSRRSHYGQVWAAVAANYYNINNVKTFSGGTEATAFNPNAINALIQTGFIISSDYKKSNPFYKVNYSDTDFSSCFSKIYNDEANPQQNFAAIMVCGSADENCPFIPNADLRIATTYSDPKEADNTPQQNETYFLRSKQMATEILYLFSLIK